MTIPLRLGILNNNDDAGNNNRIPACGFGIGGKWGPLIPGNPIIPYASTPYVGYWKLDESTGSEAIDISENILPMEYIGDLQLGITNAPYFNGATTYIRGENVALYDSTSEISIVAYYQVYDPPNPQGTIVSKYISSSEGSSWGIFLTSDGKLQIAVNGGQNVLSVNTFFEADTTYKVVFTYDGTTTKLYVNDIEEAIVGTLSGNIDKETTNINIGRTEAGTWFFKGWIRDVRIYRYVLTFEEVLALPNILINGIGGTDTPETQAYRILISAITADKTHFGLDNAYPKFSTIGIPCTITWTNIDYFEANAIAGQAMGFDNTYGILTTNSFTNNFHYGSYTINLWCYMTNWPLKSYSSNKINTLFVRDRDSGDIGYKMSILAPNVYGSSAKAKFTVATAAGDIDVYAILENDDIIDNWCMLSFIVDDTAGIVNIYKNGVLSTLVEGSYNPGTITSESYSTEARIGVMDISDRSRPEYFEGLMDEITIVGDVLTATTLLELYNTGNHYA